MQGKLKMGENGSLQNTRYIYIYIYTRLPCLFSQGGGGRCPILTPRSQMVHCHCKNAVPYYCQIELNWIVTVSLTLLGLSYNKPRLITDHQEARLAVPR